MSQDRDEPNVWRPTWQPGLNWSRLWSSAGLVIVCVAFVSTIVLTGRIGYLLWRIPTWYIDSIGLPTAGAISSYRRDMAPLLASGVQVLSAALVFSGLFLTWRQLKHNRESEYTDRFIRASEQLTAERPEARMAAINILRQLAVDSQEHRATIVAGLLEFIRGEIKRSASKTIIPTDVRLALDALRAVPTTREQERGFGLDLTGLDLSGRRLENISFRGFDLREANFTRASLVRCNLRAHLRRAVFRQSTLRDVWFSHTLDGSDFSEASIEFTTFDLAVLNEVKFTKARLQEVNFRKSAIAFGASMIDVDWNGGSLESTYDWRHVDFSGATVRNVRVIDTVGLLPAILQPGSHSIRPAQPEQKG